MKIVLLLALLAVGECSNNSVVGQTGQSVTLPCKYNYKSNKARPVCWNRGVIPYSGCNNNQLIATDGHRVLEETRASSRYQLLGRLDEGDVSLTILNVTASDAGRYGCRVDIYGPFNDAKHHFDLTVEEAAHSTTASTTAAMETSTEETTAGYTTGHMNFTGTLLTSSTSSVEAEEGSVLTVVLVCVLFGLVALVTAGGLVFIARRWTRLNKIPQQQQQVHSWAQFHSTSSTLHLHSRNSAVENIYQIDGGGEGGEYEYCP